MLHAPQSTPFLLSPSHKPSLFQSGFNPFTLSPVNTSGICKLPQENISFSLIEPELLPCGYKFHALAAYLNPTFTAHPIRSAFAIQSNICGGAFLWKCQRIKTVVCFRRRAPSWMFERILNAALPNNYLPLHQKMATFPGMFDDIPRNIWRHSPDCLATFPFSGI